jgi:hypothetical protein
LSLFLAVLNQTLRLELRAGGGAFVGLVFFLAVVAVAPFGIGPDLNLLARIGPALLWIAALLASLLGLDRLFSADRDDGTLDLVIASGESLVLFALARAIGHWFATGLPLVLAAPVLGLLLNIEPLGLAAVTLTLLVGSPALTLHRRRRRGHHRRPAARRPADGGAGAAADGPGADLRRSGHGRSDFRGGAVPFAVSALLRDYAAALALAPFAAAAALRAGGE